MNSEKLLLLLSVYKCFKSHIDYNGPYVTVKKIRALHATGRYNYTQLAKIYGVTSAMTSQIVRKLAWSYL